MVAWIARSVFDLKGQLDKDATVSIYLATAIAFTGFLMVLYLLLYYIIYYKRRKRRKRNGEIRIGVKGKRKKGKRKK